MNPCRLCLLAGLLGLNLAACSTDPASRPAPIQASSPASKPAFSQTLGKDDVRWLNRITYGVDSATIAQYQTLGRAAFLEAQLRADDDSLPPAANDALSRLDLLKPRLINALVEVDDENRRINNLPTDDDKQKARKQQRAEANNVLYETSKRHLLRALYSPAQLKEQMVWFWDNHFSVFQDKGNLRRTIADYEENAIRPHALGNFRDLLMATLKHPAMLVYLDNAQSAIGKTNENYARELLELHTMGVNGGYTQRDVQELARILTGVGVSTQDAPSMPDRVQVMYKRAGVFEFNPMRHDYADKIFLGQKIPGRGWGEVEQAVDLLVKQPATAHFISNKLALYFVSDAPPPALVDRMAHTFQESDGDITAVLRTMFSAPEFSAALGTKFKDPMHYVVSAMRLAYDGKVASNLKPVNNWLNALGEPLYGRLTPDGYGMRASDWDSSGQMSKRFEIARAIGSSNAGLFDSEDGSPPPAAGFPMLSNRLFYATIDNTMSAQLRQTLAKATSQPEWNTYLLASPDFMYR